ILTVNVCYLYPAINLQRGENMGGVNYEGKQVANTGNMQPCSYLLGESSFYVLAMEKLST
ncbi:MAG TPA: hypothetical protein P5519_13015, partial [Spirochaetia bacterium]|nr:hypothetical protein [Spirochaetia bacterium]